MRSTPAVLNFVSFDLARFDLNPLIGYKIIDVMEVRSMTYLLLRRGAAQFITAIVRMHGKAVKLRHCPATVSAPASAPVQLGIG
jgi:hypothetical protein